MTAVYVLVAIALLLGAIYVAACYIFAQMTLNSRPVAYQYVGENPQRLVVLIDACMQ